MKKNYSRPEIEIEELSTVDIIAVSNPGKDVDIDGGTLY